MLHSTLYFVSLYKELQNNKMVLYDSVPLSSRFIFLNFRVRCRWPATRTLAPLVTSSRWRPSQPLAAPTAVRTAAAASAVGRRTASPCGTTTRRTAAALPVSVAMRAADLRGGRLTAGQQKNYFLLNFPSDSCFVSRFKTQRTNGQTYAVVGAPRAKKTTISSA